MYIHSHIFLYITRLGSANKVPQNAIIHHHCQGFFPFGHLPFPNFSLPLLPGVGSNWAWPMLRSTPKALRRWWPFSQALMAALKLMTSSCRSETDSS